MPPGASVEQYRKRPGCALQCAPAHYNAATGTVVDDESPEAIANFFNGAIADYNRMHAGAATLKADDFKPVWSSADLVSPGALEALQRELVLTETEAKDSQGKGKGKA
ncbi:hypothetical protein B0H12DRAFT_1246253 [Mycena haematopus]|nr:hypothetical protein B0H12DRAFT_1246253 [Mycena haematopus]